MPELKVSQRVARGPAEVFALLTDMAAFPRFMPSVERVEVLEQEPGRTITRWVTHLSGSRFVWSEEDRFYPEQGRIAYRLVEGDLKRFEGEWRVEPAEGGVACDVSLSVAFEFGLPMLAGLLNPVAKVMLRRNVEGMLRAIAGEAGAAVTPAEPAGP